MMGKPKERRTGFFFFPQMPLGWRVSVIAALVALGIALQLKTFLIGFIVLFAGLLLTIIRRIDNTPDELKSLADEWVSATPEDIKKISERMREFKRWGRGVLNFKSCLGFLFFFFFVGILLLVTWWAANYVGGYIARIVIIDGIVILIFVFFTGNPKIYVLPNLSLKIPIFQSIMEHLQKLAEGNIEIIPMLKIAKKTEENIIPTDIRLMVKFNNAPKDFIGLQVQAGINKIGAASYPYVYAVLIGKKGFGFTQRLEGKAVREMVAKMKKKFVVEEESEEEADVLVIRQITTKTSGYHTNKSVQRTIVENSIAICRGMFEKRRADD